MLFLDRAMETLRDLNVPKRGPVSARTNIPMKDASIEKYQLELRPHSFTVRFVINLALLDPLLFLVTPVLAGGSCPSDVMNAEFSESPTFDSTLSTGCSGQLDCQTAGVRNVRLFFVNKKRVAFVLS